MLAMSTSTYLFLQVAATAACIVWYARKHPVEFGQIVARLRKRFSR